MQKSPFSNFPSSPLQTQLKDLLRMQNLPGNNEGSKDVSIMAISAGEYEDDEKLDENNQQVQLDQILRNNISP